MNVHLPHAKHGSRCSIYKISILVTPFRQWLYLKPPDEKTDVPTESSVKMKMFCACCSVMFYWRGLTNMVATGPMWLLSTWNVASATEK